MPGPVTNEACYQAIVSTKMMLAEYPGDEILGLQPMTDPRKLAAAEFVQCILLATFNSPDPRMGVLLVSKLIQMTLEHGLSEASTFAFAMYGKHLYIFRSDQLRTNEPLQDGRLSTNNFVCRHNVGTRDYERSRRRLPLWELGNQTLECAWG